jgi:hypothetical protein
VKRITGLAIAAAMAGSSPAVADSHAEAVVLFDQGIKDMRAGRLDKACPELQASLDRVKDSGTKGALARCHGLAGRTASAWLLWRELADTAPTTELRADAAAQAARLEPRLAKYTVRVARPTPHLVVEINGRSVTTDVAVAAPIDPGPLGVRARAYDGDRVVTQTWAHDYVAVEGQTVAIDVPVLAPRSAAASGAMPAPIEPSDDGNAARRHTRRIIALSLGGIALGSAAGGTLYGLDARAKYADARRLCGGAIDPCVASQVAASQVQVDRARTAATRSTVLFGVAGAAAAAGLIVWLTAPAGEAHAVVIAPSVGDGAVGVVVGGGF